MRNVHGYIPAPPIVTAIMDGDVDGFNAAFTANPSSINFNYGFGDTPLSIAMRMCTHKLRANEAEMLKLVLASGAKMQIGEMIVDISWSNNISLKDVVVILSSDKVDQSFKDSALLVAVKAKDKNAATKALDSGANILVEMDDAGFIRNAQWLAVVVEDTEMLKLLLIRGSGFKSLFHYDNTANSFWKVIGGLDKAHELAIANKDTISQSFKDAVLIKALKDGKIDIADSMCDIGSNFEALRELSPQACAVLENKLSMAVSGMSGAECRT